MRSLGIDLGGSAIKACVLDLGPPAAVLHEAATETVAEEGPAAVLDRMAAAGSQAIAAAGPVDAVGVGMPGPLDIENGRALFMTNLPGWEGQPVVAPLRERLGLPVALVNDVRAYTLAELELGAGRGASTVVCFALGTGVGGGVVVGGKLLLGMNGSIGELGHQTMEPDGPPCPCGNHGCLEQYVSGPAIARAAGLETAEQVFEAVERGDVSARRVLERAGTFLGIGIANTVLVVGPERVIVGGGVAAAGDLLLEPARRELERRVRVMPLDRIAIVPAELGPRAGAVGAALWGASQIAPAPGSDPGSDPGF
jgi:glucokinase